MKKADALKTVLGKYDSSYEGRAILAAVYKASGRTESNFLLRYMESGRALLPVWKVWGIQKYKASSGFIGFLKAGIAKAEKNGLVHTARELNDNLSDELGLDPETGKVLKTGSHEQWRQDFYTALGLQNLANDGLYASTPTRRYLRALKGSDNLSNVWQHVGALVAMEYAIGREMQMIEKGLDDACDRHIRGKFNPRAETQELRQQALKNRVYVTHHAAHDLQLHFPRLVDAVIKDMHAAAGRDTGKLEMLAGKVARGAEFIGEVRGKFYDALNRAIPSPY